MRINKQLTLIIAAVLCWGVDIADAQQSSQDDVAKAKRHFTRAQSHQRKKRYDDAAREYLRAYKLYPDADLLFNAAQAYRVDGQLEKALEYYRKYLEQEPEGRASTVSRGYIEEIRLRLGKATPESDDADANSSGARATRKERTSTQGGKNADSPSRPGQENREDGEDGEDREDGKEDGEEAREDRDQDDASTEERASEQPMDTGASGGNATLRSVGIATMGVGMASVAVGAYFGIQARSISSELSGHAGPWTSELLAKQRQGERAEQRMFLLTGIGSAVLITGGVLYVLNRPSSSGDDSSDNDGESAALQLAPVLLPSQVGLAISGRF